tara:strand:+ start:137 stop:541 length:405 start_codon:yes stop_codon:yes gene_type:complete
MPEAQAQTQIQEQTLQGEVLVVMVKTGEIRQAGMGLHLARAAAKKGADVTVIFGADAVGFPQVSGDQPVFEATGETPRQMIIEIMQNGGDVNVCKLCTVWLELEQNDFMDGVEIVNGQAIFDALYQDDAVTLEF